MLKVGVSVLLTISSISFLVSSMALSKAGLKCSFFIFENGEVWKGVLNSSNNGLIYSAIIKTCLNNNAKLWNLDKKILKNINKEYLALL